MFITPQAPRVHTLSKSSFAESEKRRALRAVQRAAVGLPRLLPVIHKNRLIAWCGWSDAMRESVVIEHRPWMDSWVDRNGLLCGYSHVDDVINNVTTNLQIRHLFWQRENNSTTPGTGWNHAYTCAGYPGAGSWSGTALTARKHDDTEVGAIMHGGNVSPATKHVLAGWFRADNGGAVTDPYVCLLYDMVLTYDKCANSSSLQSFTNTLTAGRYIGSGDPGLRIMSAFAVSAGVNTQYSQIRYTSITGAPPEHVVVPGPTMTTQFNTTFTNNVMPSAFGTTVTNIRSILEAPLRNGDSGVKQLDDYTMASTNTDTISFILGFQLAWLTASEGDFVYTLDFVKQCPAAPRIRDGACLTIAFCANSTNTCWMGGYTVGWA